MNLYPYSGHISYKQLWSTAPRQSIYGWTWILTQDILVISSFDPQPLDSLSMDELESLLRTYISYKQLWSTAPGQSIYGWTWILTQDILVISSFDPQPLDSLSMDELESLLRTYISYKQLWSTAPGQSIYGWTCILTQDILVISSFDPQPLDSLSMDELESLLRTYISYK